MRKSTEQINKDKYIKNLARQVIKATGIDERDFPPPPSSQREFADEIAPRVEGWVKANITNPETMTRVIICAMSSTQGNLEQRGRMSPLCNTVPICFDGNGDEWLRLLATRTLCSAIYDHLFFTLYSAPADQREAQREEDEAVEAQVRFWENENKRSARSY